MVDFTFDLVWPSIILIVFIGGYLISKNIRNPDALARENYKKIKKLDDDYIKRLEDELKELDSDYISLQNSMNRAQRGPAVEGNTSEIGTVLPDLLKEYGHLAPKWAQPFLQDVNTQKWIIEFIQKNPDKAKEWFGKLVKGTIGKGGKSEQSEVSTLSV